MISSSNSTKLENHVTHQTSNDVPLASKSLSSTCKPNVTVNAQSKLYAANRRLGSLLPRFKRA